MITPVPKPKRRSPKAPTRVPRKRTNPRRAVGKCPELVAWIHGQTTWLPFGKLWYITEAAHLPRSRRLGGDLNNVIPLARSQHQRQHQIGLKSWLAEVGKTREELVEAAREYTVRFCRETGHVVPEGDQT